MGAVPLRWSWQVAAATAELAAQKLKPAERQKIEQALALRVPPATKSQLKQQRLQNLKQNLTVARRQVQKLKAEMRAVRGAE